MQIKAATRQPAFVEGNCEWQAQCREARKQANERNKKLLTQVASIKRGRVLRTHHSQNESQKENNKKQQKQRSYSPLLWPLILYHLPHLFMTADLLASLAAIGHWDSPTKAETCASMHTYTHTMYVYK